MILVINNSRDLYKATMAPKLLGILRALKIKYIIIEKKKELKQIKKKYPNQEIKGIILTGGPLCISDNVYYKDIIKNITAIQLFPNIPVLGICFGFQVLGDIYGGTIDKLHYHNLGFKQIDISKCELELFQDIKQKKDIHTFFFSHNDQITHIPPTFNCFVVNDIVIGI
jgi:GMP synthase-like glutamine amidotransferase